MYNLFHEWCSSIAVVAVIKLFFTYLFVSSPVLLSNLNKWCWHVREWRRDIRDGVWQIVRCFCQPLKIQISNTNSSHTFFNFSLPLSSFQCCDVEFGAENFTVGNATVCYIQKISRSAPKMFSVYFQLMAIIFQTFQSLPFTLLVRLQQMDNFA